MERTTWLTEERIAASATGAPARGRAAGLATVADLRIQKQCGSVPAAYGPDLVCGSASVGFPTNGHVEMGRTAWDGTPLGSLGNGHG